MTITDLQNQLSQQISEKVRCRMFARRLKNVFLQMYLSFSVVNSIITLWFCLQRSC